MPRLNKRLKEELEKDPFYFPGRVHPKDYDWRRKFALMAWEANKRVAEYEVVMELPPLLGLVSYAADLENQNEQLSGEVTQLRNAVLALLNSVPKSKAKLLEQQYEGIGKALDWERKKMFE